MQADLGGNREGGEVDGENQRKAGYLLQSLRFCFIPGYMDVRAWEVLSRRGQGDQMTNHRLYRCETCGHDSRESIAELQSELAAARQRIADQNVDMRRLMDTCNQNAMERNDAFEQVAKLEELRDQLTAICNKQTRRITELETQLAESQRTVLAEVANYIERQSKDPKWSPSSDGELEHFASHLADDVRNDWMAEVEASAEREA